MKIKKLGTVAAVIAAVGLVGAAPANAKLKRINIGSNPAGSVYFLLAGGFAKMFQKQTKIRSVAQPHAGSSVYLPLMDVGEIVLGLNSSLDSGMAFNGKAPFKQRHLGVKSLARVWILPYGYMTKESSGIKTIADFKGKRIVVNFRTNVSLGQLNRTILGTAGLTMNDVTAVVSGGVVAGINMVVENRVDAVTVATGMPARSPGMAWLSHCISRPMVAGRSRRSSSASMSLSRLSAFLLARKDCVSDSVGKMPITSRYTRRTNVVSSQTFDRGNCN